MVVPTVPEEAARLEKLDQALSDRRGKEHQTYLPGTFRNGDIAPHRDVPDNGMCRYTIPAMWRVSHIPLPGTPRGARPILVLPFSKEAAARLNSVVADAPINHSSDRAVRATIVAGTVTVSGTGTGSGTPAVGEERIQSRWWRHGSGARHLEGSRHRVRSMAMRWRPSQAPGPLAIVARP
jgi:hypothetical protein